VLSAECCVFLAYSALSTLFHHRPCAYGRYDGVGRFSRCTRAQPQCRPARCNDGETPFGTTSTKVRVRLSAGPPQTYTFAFHPKCVIMLQLPPCLSIPRFVRTVLPFLNHW